FASWLGSICPLPVEIAEDGATLSRGRIYLSKGERHLVADGMRLRLEASAPLCGQRPSRTVLFDSVAKSFGRQALAVLLPGMGEDGAEGLLEVRRRGGHTIAEHESTAVVYGMPDAAVRLGAVCESLPLPEIAPRILELAITKQEVA